MAVIQQSWLCGLGGSIGLGCGSRPSVRWWGNRCLVWWFILVCIPFGWEILGRVLVGPVCYRLVWRRLLGTRSLRLEGLRSLHAFCLQVLLWRRWWQIRLARVSFSVPSRSPTPGPIQEGVETGTDLEELLNLSRHLETTIGRKLDGMLMKAE